MASARDKIRKVIEENLTITFKDHESMGPLSNNEIGILNSRVENVVDLIIDAIKDSDKII